MMHSPIKRCRELGTIDGERKAAAEFNPFFPVERLKQELIGPEGDSVLEVVSSILALFAFFTMLGLWMGAL